MAELEQAVVEGGTTGRRYTMAERIGFCFEGIATGLREERAVRDQTLGLVAMLITLFILQPDPIWWGATLFTQLSVIALELVNSALETLCDHVTPERHPAIKRIKDLCGGAVIIGSFGVLIIGLAMILETVGGL